MKEIIAEVFQAEDKVNVVLKQARERAAEVKRIAESEASETVAQAKQEAREILQAAVERAKEQAERIRKERLEQVDCDEDALLHGNEETTDRLIEKICRIVLEAEHEK